MRLEYSDFVRISLAMNYMNEDELGGFEVRNVVLDAIENQKTRFSRAVGLEVDAQMREIKDALNALRDRAEDATIDDVSFDHSAAVNKIEDLQNLVDERVGRVKNINRLANAVSFAITVIPFFIMILGISAIALRDIGISDILSVSLDSWVVAASRFVGSLIAAVLTVFGLSCFSIYDPIRDFVKVKLLRIEL